MKLSSHFLTKRKGGYVTFGDNEKGKIIIQENVGNKLIKHFSLLKMCCQLIV